MAADAGTQLRRDARDLKNGDVISRRFLPEGKPAEVVTCSPSRWNQVHVTYVLPDGVETCDYFLAGASIPLEAEGVSLTGEEPPAPVDVDAAKFSDNGWTRAAAQAYDDDEDLFEGRTTAVAEAKPDTHVEPLGRAARNGASHA